MVVGKYEIAAESSSGGCLVFEIDHSENQELVPLNHVSIDAFVAELSANAHVAGELSSARQWVAESLYPEERSLRTLRLRAGLTQAELAQRIGVNRPYFPRLGQVPGSNVQFATKKDHIEEALCGAGCRPEHVGRVFDWKRSEK